VDRHRHRAGEGLKQDIVEGTHGDGTSHRKRTD
jgi:hypothetical protein